MRISGRSLLIQKLALGVRLTNEVSLFAKLHIGALRDQLARSSRRGLNINGLSVGLRCL